MDHAEARKLEQRKQRHDERLFAALGQQLAERQPTPRDYAHKLVHAFFYLAFLGHGVRDFVPEDRILDVLGRGAALFDARL